MCFSPSEQWRSLGLFSLLIIFFLQDFDPEKRKVICKTLRFVAHYYGASLMVSPSPVQRGGARLTDVITDAPLSSFFPTAKAPGLQTTRQGVHRAHSACGFSSPRRLYLSIRLGKLTEVDCCIRSFSFFPLKN